MEFISEWLIKGVGFGIATLSWAVTLVTATGLVAAIFGIISGVIESVKERTKKNER